MGEEEILGKGKRSAPNAATCKTGSELQVFSRDRVCLIQTANLLVSRCLFPQKGCMEGLFCQTQLYMNLFCANMMDLNQRAEAIGYAYSTQDIFMENSGPRRVALGTKQQGVPNSGHTHMCMRAHTHTESRAARFSK